MKDFTIKQAIEVVETDYEYGGICSAIELLESYGYDTTPYYEYFNKFTEKEIDNDFDNINIQARDNLYDILGISDLIEQAYKITEERGF